MKDKKTKGKPEPVVARLDVSQARRIIGVGVQIALGFVFISLAGTFPRDQMLLRLVMLGLGLLVFYFAYVTWMVTETALILTDSGLRDDKGRLLAEMDNVREISRGALALKPSNGFTIVLYKGTGFAWVPGLWWRIGNRVGVGGVTPSQAGRYMAEMIAMKIAERPE